MLRILFALNMRGLLSGMLFRGSTKKAGKGRVILFSALMVYAAVMVMFSCAMMFRTMLQPFYGAGIGWMYFSLMAMFAFGLSVFGTLFIAHAQLFGAKDNDALLSMPIKPSHILLARLLVLFTMEVLFTLIIAIPAAAVWFWDGYATIAGAIFLLLGALLTPVLSMTVSLILAWVLSLTTAKARFKNIITLVVSVAFLVAYLWGFASLQQALNSLIQRGTEIAEAFKTALPPFYALGAAVADGNILQLLLFALWSLIPFAVVYSLLSSRYLKILTTNKGSAKVKYKERALKRTGACFALVKKEFAHYWSRPMVILNTSIGSLFMLIGAVAVVIKRDAILAQLQPYSALLGGVTAALLGAVILVAVCSMNDLSASLISLEGNHLWIAKSIPVDTTTLLLSKVYTQLLLSSIPCLLASIAIAWAASASMAELALLILLPQAFIAFLAFAGLLVNLLFPKLDWTNEIIVVKQSVAVLIGMFGAMAIVLALGLLYGFALKSTLSLSAFLWLCTAVFAVGAAACGQVLRTKGKALFEGL